MSESTRQIEVHLTVLRAMRAEGSMMGVPTELEALDAAIAALSAGEKAPDGVVCAATLDDAAADDALTLDTARELLRDAAQGLRYYVDGEKAEAGGGEAVAFYCEHKHRCKWMAAGGYPAWGTPERHLEAWQEKHREYCGGEFHLLYTAQPASGAVPDDSPAATATLLAFVARIMRDHRAQLPSETRDLYGGGCGCPQCDEARQLLAAAKKEAERKG